MATKKITVIFLLCFFMCVFAKKNKKYSVSVIIPCTYKHAGLLYPLLKLYEVQTHIPQEVVVSLSEAQKVSPKILHALKNEKWPFSFKLLLHKEVKYAGQNRNIACEHASGDIFICQDADDIPHPQRVEIISYFFEKFDIDHVMHYWIFPVDFKVFSSMSIADINYFYPTNYKESWCSGPIHNGNIAISRSVFKKIKWQEVAKGQDVRYNQAVYENFSKRMVIKVPLIIYRKELSAWEKESPLEISCFDNIDLYSLSD